MSMRMQYVSQITSNLKKSVIGTKKVTSRVLDGSYVSVFKGRSSNFDELREYVIGDDIKDMDWKASARSQKLLVRQYVAEKKHNILFVMDTNKRMLADTQMEQEKRQVALLGAGTLAYLINQNGDYVSAMFAKENIVKYLPFDTGLGNIERILANYHNSVTMENTSDLNKTIDYVLHTIRQRMIIVLVTDLEGMRTVTDSNLKRLLVRNDVLILCVGDSSATGKKVYDIGQESYLPAFITEDKKLIEMQESRRKALEEECMQKVKHFGIPMSTLEQKEDIDKKILELLEKH